MSRNYSLLNGDSYALMESMPDSCVDVTITDPPYDEKTHTGARASGGKLIAKSTIDFEPLEKEGIQRLVCELLRVTRRWVVCFCSLEHLGAYKAAAGDSWIRGGFWRKTNAAPQFTGDRPAQGGEGVAIMHRKGRKQWNGGGHHAFWAYPVETGKDVRIHPAQKPLALMIELVKLFSNKNEIIFDPFMGSGSIEEASLLNSRKVLGVELVESYFNDAKERIEASVAGLTVAQMRAGQTTFGFGI